MFSTDIRTFTIDLNLPEEQRWAEVIAGTRDVTPAVMREAEHELRHVPWFIRRLFMHLYRVHGGEFRGEIKAWARGLGISVGTATVLNCSYELSHLYMPRIFGCTAGVRFIEGKGMVHVRTLDWNMPSIGDATSIFRFRRGEREFLTIGVPGMVGVLSGMVPGGYSVTINWAPPSSWPNWNWGPAFFLRHVLETCDTYEDAVAMLRDTPLSTSVFYTVCGIKEGQGCVIERTKRAAVVRELTQGAVTQANHHEAEIFTPHNAKIALLEATEFATESVTRARLMHSSLRDHTQGEDIACVLDLPPVLNAETVQKMVFCPATGEITVWRRPTQQG